MEPAHPRDTVQGIRPARGRTGARTRPPPTSSATPGLFAQRTRVMRSSAMRDLMEITSRPGGDLARRRLPRHVHLPARVVRRADDADRPGDRARGRSSTGRPRASSETRAVICEVMAAEEMSPDPDDIVVTSGGQQALDLICKALLDPGDVVIAEGPTYPGAVPGLLLLRGRHPPGRDGRGRDADRRARGAARRARPRGAPPEVHLLGADLPEPGRRDPRPRSPPPARRDRPRARDPPDRGQPLRPAPLRGRPAADALLARRRRLRPLPGHVLEDPLPRDQGRLGLRAAADPLRSSCSASRPPTSAPRR